MAKYEVVISGVAGSFPECPDTETVQEKLFTDENFVTELDPKWKLGDLNIPCYGGKIKDPFAFDQMFFGIHRKLCVVLDTHIRHCLEKTYEALIDAGINPKDVNGDNVAVLMCAMTSETEYGSVVMSKSSGHAMVGISRAMQANRISYFFNFKGPSLSLDCSWIGGLQVLQIAADLVSRGYVKTAIVGASNMTVYPELSVHYESLKKLNPEGKTKSFSSDAEGYNRSEGVIVFVVQRAEDALRSYGSIVKVDCCGEMDYHGKIFSESVGFDRFLKKFYSDLPINKSDIGYIEGDGSASLRLDALELNGVADVICKDRNKPLLIGSCKTRFGHGESSAALMSIMNALITFKTGFIPPSIHYSSPNPLVPALIDGRLKMVTEKTPFEGEYIGINGFALSNVFSHCILKINPKTRPIKNTSYFPSDNIPRLFLLSGRDEHKMSAILKKVGSKPVDENLYALNHKVFKTNFVKHLFRGYAVVAENKIASNVTSYQGGAQRPIWYIFSGMGSQWNGMGIGVMKIPVIRRAIEKCHNVLLSKGLDLISIITSDDPQIFDNILHAFVGIAAIQIGLVDLLEEVGIRPDGIVGHSVGELGCSYADKCLTAEQVILAAYARGKASNDAKLIKGMMAAVGRGYSQIKNDLPEGIEVACHNSSSSCTLSGPAEDMKLYVDELKKKGIFAKLVNVANIAYHSKNIAPAAPYLLKYLKEIIPQPKERSSKWISSSSPEDQWDTDLARYCSAEYHTNNLLSYVLFEEATAHVPKDAICIEIAPHGLLQAIVKKSLPSCSHIPLTKKIMQDGSFFLMEALGNLFTTGVLMDLSSVYPPVEFPVPRETEFLNVVTWDHSELWVPLALQFEKSDCAKDQCWHDLILETLEENVIDFDSNHKIRGQLFYPKSKLLVYLANHLKRQAEKNSTKFKYYSFQNIHFQRDLPFIKKEDSLVRILLQKGNGNFEALFHNEDTVVTGELTLEFKGLPPPFLNADYFINQGKQIFVSENQIYDYFEAYDCLYNGPFRNITSITIYETGFAGKVKWRQNEEFYLDAILKLIIFYSSILQDSLLDVDKILELMYDPSELPKHDQDIDVYFGVNMGYVTAQGVRIKMFRTKPVAHKMSDTLDLKNHYFLPYSKIDAMADFTDLCLQIFKENIFSDKLNLQFVVDGNSNMSKYIAHRINNKDQLTNYKITLRQRNTVSVVLAETSTNSNYLIIAENGYYADIKNLIQANGQFYFIHTGNVADLQKQVSLNDLTPIISQEINGRSVVLYKQKRYKLKNLVFLEISVDNFSKEIKTIEDAGPDNVYFLIIKYRLLTDVASVLLSSFERAICHKRCCRLLFIDESSPRFDPNNPFYKDQLAKDLKINIAFKKSWGSLRDKTISPSSQILGDELALTIPLNHIRCKNVDLKVIGINLQSLVNPNKFRKISVVEYAGIKDSEAVFGLGKLTDDNYLEVDSYLCWKKPDEWTMEEAVTIPLYHSMAYDILCEKFICEHRPCKSVLVFAGHSAFGQAVISVAFGINLQVHATCSSEKQKHFLLRKFPKLKQDYIYVINENNSTALDKTLETLKTECPEMVISPLEDHDFKNTLMCSGNKGTCVFMTHSDIDITQNVGMNILAGETALCGYNPEMCLDWSDSKKAVIKKYLNKNIKSGVVKPLDRFCITQTLSKNEAADLIVSKSHEEFSKKFIMPVNRHPKKISGLRASKELTHKKNYMIVGTYNNLWFDLLKWIVSKGADTVHVILYEDAVPDYLKKRFTNFIAKHKSIRVFFSGVENLNTAQNCALFIKGMQNGNTLDTVFYVKPGFEKQMANMDCALRLHSKTSCLVAIGLQACQITEKRRNDGLQGVSFILMKNSLRNCMVLDALDNWFNKCDECDDVILLDKAKQKVAEQLDKIPEVLPCSGYELVDLFRESLIKPSFVEIPTKCPNKHHARDVNPVIIFPGLRINEIKEFSKKLIYPAFMACYPPSIKSLDDLALLLSKIIMETFDYNMFTLIGEGWSGPLVLTVAKILEEHGKDSEVILINGAPDSVFQWNVYSEKSTNVITKNMPSMRDVEVMTVNDLRNWSSFLSKTISLEEEGGFTQDEIQLGLDILINRLDVVQKYSCKNKTLQSTVHLFIPSCVDINIFDLKKMCVESFTHHLVDTSESFFNNPDLIRDVNNLPLHEYKLRAAKQVVKDIGKLEFIGENATSMYNSEGFEVTAIGISRDNAIH